MKSHTGMKVVGFYWETSKESFSIRIEDVNGDTIEDMKQLLGAKAMMRGLYFNLI